MHIANYTLSDTKEGVNTEVCPCDEEIGDPRVSLVAVVAGFSYPVDAECGSVNTFDPFTRGDCNGDNAYNIADAVFTANFLFGSGDPAPCLDACDSNDDGNVDIAEVIYTALYLFADGLPPPEPYLDCGGDPTPDDLDCAEPLLECP